MGREHKEDDKRIFDIIYEDMKSQGIKFLDNNRVFLHKNAIQEARARGGFTIGQLVHLAFMNDQLALTFNDVTGAPYQALSSRKEANLSTVLHPQIKLPLPIFSSNMECVTGYDLAIMLASFGGMAITHQFDNDPRVQAGIIERVKNTEVVPLSIDDMTYTPALDTQGRYLVGGAIGVRKGSLDRAQALADSGVDLFVVDIAHGHSGHLADIVSSLTAKFSIPVAAGNVVTPKGADYVCQAGADILKVGVGPGAACTTRKVTGYGVPQVTSIYQTALIAKHYGRTILADGGIKGSGDIIKALGTGAQAVMLGGMFAPTDRSNNFKDRIIETDDKGTPLTIKYFGSASSESKMEQGRSEYDAPEGETIALPYAGPTRKLLAELDMGLRSGISYAGCNGESCDLGATITRLQKDSLWVRQTASGIYEGLKN